MDPLDQPLAAISAQLAEGTITARRWSRRRRRATIRHSTPIRAGRPILPGGKRRRPCSFRCRQSPGIAAHPGLGQGHLWRGGPRSCRQPARASARWRQEGAVVHRLRRQLAVIMGKSHMVEFAFGGLGVNAHWPVPGTCKTARSIARRGLGGAGVSLGEDGPCRVWHRHRRIGAHPGKRHRHRRREDHRGPLADRRHRSAQPDSRHAGTLTRARPMPPSCSRASMAKSRLSSISGRPGRTVAEPFFWEGPIPAWRSGWRRV